MRGLTRNQTELLTHLKGGGPDGDLDFDQLLGMLSWQPTKESAQFTIRALVAKGMLEKLPELQFRRSRKRICYRITPAGLEALDPRDPLPRALAAAAHKVEGLAPEVLDFELDEVVSTGTQEGDEYFSPGAVFLEVG